MITRREMAFAAVVLGFGSVLLYKATEPRRQERLRYFCYSNLMQIGVAVMQYANDNDDIYPRASYGGQSSGGGHKWMDAILPYARRTKIFTCPSDKVNQPYLYRSDHTYGSYIINNAYFLPKDSQTPPESMRQDKVGSPRHYSFRDGWRKQLSVCLAGCLAHTSLSGG